MKRIRGIQWSLFVIAVALQISNLSAQDAQKKEINPSTVVTPPSLIPPDAQRKEDPLRPITVAVNWLIGIVPSAQHKE